MKTKRENIAEYILHLWQMEDVVRAFADDEALAQNEFLSDLLNMMRTEGVMQSGHVQLAKNAMQEAEETHAQLLQEATYRAAVMQLQPSLALLKSKSANPAATDIEIMFVFLYSIMMLRLQKKEITADTQLMLQQVSKLLVRLSLEYKQQKESES
ncbi:MAG: DUF4924 family protein [Paludibacter sp.]|nr:DUF4924 family protein [Bacteroidales bacterium]MCM1069257.1 DUF4924 family protein [Prevotella sp.]MCM1353760.1 DUF4924 family protein [Bacteroides sp.]MCM1442172.1 DUF4924 family protein [Muribaculum sp.]MCM1482531.1 DUF4924 family protein [Paludibacter sp.]